MSNWHFYEVSTGRPVLQIIGANGKERAPTLRDAKEGLKGLLPPYSIVPSVTSIIHAAGQPHGLVNWRLQQVAEAACRRQGQEYIDAETYVPLILDEAEKASRDARDLGTAFHHYIEWYLSHGEWPPESSPHRDKLLLVEAWFHANVSRVIASERSFATYEYGGKYDLIAELRFGGTWLIDFKTQAVKEDNGFRKYDEWGEQLVGYQLGCGQRVDGLLNLVVNVNAPGVSEVVWTKPKALYNRIAQQWRLKLRLFKLMHNWKPRKRK